MEDAPEIRSDIWELESAFYNKLTNIIPRYLHANKYEISVDDQNKFRNEIKEKTGVNSPKGLLSLGDHYVAESFMKRCFTKCRQFVLEDWIDYDELDATMKCAILHKKSYEIMKETYNNL
jgi:hypothetical protein